MKLTPIPHLLWLSGTASRSSIGRVALHLLRMARKLEATMSHFFTHSALTLNSKKVGTIKAKKDYHRATAALKNAKAVTIKNHLFAAG